MTLQIPAEQIDHIDQRVYNAEYYERGLETGKSCYQNYRWIPELTVPMAMTIVDYLRIQRKETVLDFGCAKGYLVKALRWLYREAWGVDASEYAIKEADPEIKKFVRLATSECLTGWNTWFQWCIAKDVFEHIPLELVGDTVKRITARMLFAVIPLGENGQFRAPANNMDITHVTCLPEDDWERIFGRCGWETIRMTFRIRGIKDSYAIEHPNAHGFFLFRRRGK